MTRTIVTSKETDLSKRQFDLAAAARTYYSETDLEGTPAFERWLAPNCRLAINDNDPIIGTNAVAAATMARRQGFRKIEHRIANAVVNEDALTVALEIRVHYTSESGQLTIVSGASFIRFSEGKIATLNVYVDPTALNAIRSA